MLAAMGVAMVLGMLFRKHELIWQLLIVLLSVSVTVLYFVFPGRLM